MYLTRLNEIFTIYLQQISVFVKCLLVQFYDRCRQLQSTLVLWTPRYKGHPDNNGQQLNPRKNAFDWNKLPLLRTLAHEDTDSRSLPQGPHSDILMTGGSDRGSYFIPKKIPTSEFVYPKKTLLLLTYPKKSLSVFASANFIIYLLES